MLWTNLYGLNTNTRYKFLHSFDNLNGKVKFLAANVVWQQKSTKQGFTARIVPQLMKTCTTKVWELTVIGPFPNIRRKKVKSP